MERRAIIISAAVFLLLICSTVFAHKFRIGCRSQTVKTCAAYASCSNLDSLSEQRYYNVDSRVYIKNFSNRPVKLLKVAFVGDKTGIIKEFVNEANTVEVAPLKFRYFTANNETIPADEYERPRFPPLPGQVAEKISFYVEWEADTCVTPPIITAELIMPPLHLFYEPILLNCEVINQW